ncbi:MAG: TatD family hydrolase [Opitutales bacterium]|nr:TatD family hydrolase [Opitutales bacterium]
MRCDAHTHLQDPRFAAAGFDVPAWLRERSGAYACAVNATDEADWDAVARLAEHPGVHPVYGLHPWKIAGRRRGWEERLCLRLEGDPSAGVGETGLDRWIEGHDLDDQLGVFRVHMKIAAELNRPLTVHCLRAWGAMRDCLAAGPLPERGFLLHAYGGPAEMLGSFVDMGAYFSFSTYFTDPRRHRVRDTFAHIPAERLLVETDAPAMPPPPRLNRNHLDDPEDGSPLNHPANLALALAALAEIRSETVAALEQRTAENFLRWWGGPAADD